jgi:hypothetical protein
MPTIRAIRPTDLIPLIAFFRDGSNRKVTAQAWPEVQGDAGARVMRQLIRRLMVHPGGYAQAWVCMTGGAVRGLAIARARAGKLAWDVQDLFVTDCDRSSCVDLLEQLAAEAVRNGARRVFLSTAVDGEASRLARQAGFVHYTSETLFAMKLAAQASGEGLPAARPRLRRDAHALFQLYNVAVPCKVRFAEAATIEEWSSLDRGSRPWAPRLGGNNQHYVWDEGDGLTGWLQLVFGTSSQHMSLVVHPSSAGATDEMVRYALSLASHKVPIYASAREYQPELISSLESVGFARVAECMVFSREMTARVPSRAFVPARA